jgi:hypothetical protein
MKTSKRTVYYFAKYGPSNTDRVIDAVQERLREDNRVVVQLCK